MLKRSLAFWIETFSEDYFNHMQCTDVTKVMFFFWKNPYLLHIQSCILCNKKRWTYMYLFTSWLFWISCCRIFPDWDERYQVLECWHGGSSWTSETIRSYLLNESAVINNKIQLSIYIIFNSIYYYWDIIETCMHMHCITYINL